MEPAFLSVVIPAYNEAKRIRGSLESVIGCLEARNYTWEIIVADDGSTDSTAALVEELAARQRGIELLRLPHRGKGMAVKRGMLRARGSYRFMCDADLSMPIEQIDRFLPPALDSFDIAIGSREAALSRRIGEPLRRHWMGRMYNLWVRLAAVPAIQDTQCGFKCFLGPVADELFSAQRLPGWAFDVEILFLARRRGMKIAEIPIDWHYREESKVNPLRDAGLMFWDVLRVRWNQHRGLYGQDRTR